MVITKIGVWSAAKLSAALYAAIGLLMGLIIGLISMVGAGIAASQEAQEMPPWLVPLFGVGAIVFAPIMYGLMGLVLGALTAAIYNLVARMVGGLELDIQPGGKV